MNRLIKYKEPVNVFPINRFYNETVNCLKIDPMLQEVIGYALGLSNGMAIDSHESAISAYHGIKHQYMIPNNEEIERSALAIKQSIQIQSIHGIKLCLEYAHMLTISNFFCNNSFRQWEESIEEEEFDPYGDLNSFQEMMGVESSVKISYNPPILKQKNHDRLYEVRKQDPVSHYRVLYKYYKTDYLPNNMIKASHIISKTFELNDPSKDFLFIMKDGFISKEDSRPLQNIGQMPEFIAAQQIISRLGMACITIGKYTKRDYGGDSFKKFPSLICIV